jgi:hypothetical protein
MGNVWSFLLIVSLFIVQFSLSAQEVSQSEDKDTFKHSLGIGAGFTTGYGLSYRFYPKRFGVQTNFAPYKDNARNEYSFGLTLLFKLVETDKTNLFLYQGNHYFYRKEKHPYWNQSEIISRYLNNGIGIGIEFIILKRVSFNLMGGYAGYRDFDQISITGETCLYFKF